MGTPQIPPHTCTTCSDMMFLHPFHSVHSVYSLRSCKALSSKFCWLTCWARSWCRVIYGDSHSLQGAYAATCHMSWFDSAKHVSLEFVLHETIEVRTASCLHGCLLPRFWSLTSHFTQVWRPKQSFLTILWGLHTMETSVWTFSSKLLLEYDRMNIVRRSIRTAIKFCLLQKKPRRTEYLEAKLRRPHRIWWHTMSYINI